ENFYYVRIRAKNTATGATSGYTAALALRTPSAAALGGPRVYEIGPGKTYASLAALDWRQLGPGDTVRIYPKKNASGQVVPYFEKLLISVRGTAAAPTTITGVPDPTTGELPILDGTNAVAAAQFASHYQPLEDYSLVLIGTRPDNNANTGYSPGYLTLAN